MNGPDNTTRVLRAPGIGKTAPLRLGVSGVIFDAGSRVLLMQRSDNGLWCLPGGQVDPGEPVATAVAREVKEETGLDVAVERLVGVYSDPDRITIYPDGNRAWYVILSFLCRELGGTFTFSDETLALGYFDPTTLPELLFGHAERIADALQHQAAAFIR